MRFAGHLAIAGLLAGCAPAEAPRIELPVVVDSSGLDVATTNLGWTIEFTQARLALANLEFTTAGEVDMGRRSGDSRPLLGWVASALIPSAWAHPGHYQGGEVIGELAGTFVVDFVSEDGRELGMATMIVAEYTAYNFHFERAGEVDDGDPLLGHTALLAGNATGPGGEIVAFTVVMDSPLDRDLVGAPFEVTLEESSTFEIGLRMLSTDPYEGDHLFDGIDFLALDAVDGAADGVLLLVDPETAEVGPELTDAYYQIRRDFQTHDLFDAIKREP